MTDIHDRFRSLDELDVPDVHARARLIGPKEPLEPRSSGARRVGVIILASVVAAAGFGLLLRARGTEDEVPLATTTAATRTATATASVAPASQGLVAFAAQLRGSTTGLVIAVMRPDGTGFRQLTGLPADHQADPQIARYSYASDGSPSFSPDGRTVAFVRAYTEGINSLCMIDADGSNFRVVKRDAQMGRSPGRPTAGRSRSTRNRTEASTLLTSMARTSACSGSGPVARTRIPPRGRPTARVSTTPEGTSGSRTLTAAARGCSRTSRDTLARWRCRRTVPRSHFRSRNPEGTAVRSGSWMRTARTCDA